MGSPFGIVALIMGIIALATFFLLGWWALGVITAILAIIFGAIGIAKDDSKVMAIIGLVFGMIVIVLIILIIIFIATFFYAISNA